MARKKVNLAWIPNDAVRRATFKKRRRGLLKKVQELSILCDVKACAIIYGPHEAQPEVWPSESEARKLLLRFRAKPEIEQSKKMMTQEAFLDQRAKKIYEQFHKIDRENRELENTVLIYECFAGCGTVEMLGIDDASTLLYYVDMKLKVVYEKMEAVRVKMANWVQNGGLVEPFGGGGDWMGEQNMFNFPGMM